MLRKVISFVGKILIFFVTLVLLYVVAALVIPYITTDAIEETPEVEIYISTTSVHTDIIVPIKNEIYNWSKQVRFEHTQSKRTHYQYLAIGWGSRDFYLHTPTWNDLTFSTAFKASFGLSKSVFHTNFYQEIALNENTKKITISAKQYQQLIQFIESRFKKDKLGQYIPIASNYAYSTYDAFYEAYGSYSMFYTCNTWANEALKSCAQKACLWTSLPNIPQ